ncbi:MAG: SPOR domain-containing protein [Acidobacteria bacterium]|nr:SPOR domain-containing protein [Acidobacteriota bacterium]
MITDNQSKPATQASLASPPVFYARHEDKKERQDKPAQNSASLNKAAAQPGARAATPAAGSRQAVTVKDSGAKRAPAPISHPPDRDKIGAPPSLALLSAPVAVQAILPAKAVIVPFSGAPTRGQEGDSLLAMYLDVGRFKDELIAQNLRERVAQLGLRSTVTRKGHLWGNSYQVLVGPYGDEDQEAAIERELRSHGYQPRPFERGSRDFEFASPLVVNALKLPAGDLVVSWESYVRDAKVKFAQGRNIMTTTDAIWRQKPYTYWRNEYVYIKQGDGSRTLVELHFSGLNRVLTFVN